MAAANALNRVGRPSDVADIVGFLASDDARWSTGQILEASGGCFLGPACNALTQRPVSSVEQ